jgi:hypothetical protein
MIGMVEDGLALVGYYIHQVCTRWQRPPNGISVQVPAVLGLEHAYATTMQSIGSALHGAAGATPLRQVVKSAFSLVVTTGMSTGGLHGPFKGLRRWVFPC